MSMMEVSVRDVNGDEHIYWVSLKKKPKGEDDIDWSIEKALKFHGENVGTEPDEGDDDDLPVTAYEPFERSKDEYTLIR